MKDAKILLEKTLENTTFSQADEELLFKIIPELTAEKNFPQNNPWHIYDVWEHTKKTLEKADNDIQIRIALLLHDIGKPHCYTDDEKGVRHFRGHSQVSAEMALDILTRLGYTEDEIADISLLICYHDTKIPPGIINKYNIDIVKKLLHVQYCDASGYNPEYYPRVSKRLDELAKYIKDFKN